MKTLILLFYYERPRLVQAALESIKNSTWDDWELAFIDDGSETPGKPLCEKFFPDDPRVKYFNTNDSIEDKQNRGMGINGSVFGGLANQAMDESDADLVIMLCDDDALTADYLENLSKYFEENPFVMYAYSHVIIYDPRREDYKTKKYHTRHPLNQYTVPIAPVNNLDSTQVAWRLKENRDVRFPCPHTVALDAVVYGQLYSKHGNCEYTGFVGQYKGWHDHQLGRTRSFEVVD